MPKSMLSQHAWEGAGGGGGLVASGGVSGRGNKEELKGQKGN